MIVQSERLKAPRLAAVPFTRDAAGVWADIPAFTAFAQEVARSMDSGQLRFDQRQHLLRRATHLGIRRFDANLIIAMVQNRAGISTMGLHEAPGRSSRWPLIATVLALQSLIIAAGWWLLA